MSEELVTIKDVAAALRLAEKTAYSMTKQGELPALKVRGQWRVHRSDFWARMDEQAHCSRAVDGEAAR